MKSFKNWMKKGIALGAAFTMTVTALPLSDVVLAAGTDDAAAKAEDDGLILWYNFEGLGTGTVISDASENGRNGVVRPTGSGVTTADVNIYGTDYTAYSFKGGQAQRGKYLY